MKRTFNINKQLILEDWADIKKFINVKILDKTKANGYDENGTNYNKDNDENFYKQYQAPETPDHMYNYSLGLQENSFIYQKLRDEQAIRAANAVEEPSMLKKAATGLGLTAGLFGATGAALYYGGKKIGEILDPNTIQEGSNLYTYNIDKQMLLQEARNPKTGAGSTLEDVEIKNSASPFFEMASSKTGKNKDGDTFGSASALFTKASKKPVEDNVPVEEEVRNFKKLQTRMVS